jgi:hypothetical protein
MSPDTAICPPGEVGMEQNCLQLTTTVARRNVTMEKEIHINNIEAIIEPLIQDFCANYCCERFRGKYFLPLLSYAPLGNQWIKVV